MKKLIIALVISLSFTSCINAEEKTTEELIAELKQVQNELEESESRIKILKEESKALDKLENTVNELSQTLGVNEK